MERTLCSTAISLDFIHRSLGVIQQRKTSFTICVKESWMRFTLCNFILIIIGLYIKLQNVLPLAPLDLPRGLWCCTLWELRNLTKHCFQTASFETWSQLFFFIIKVSCPGVPRYSEIQSINYRNKINWNRPQIIFLCFNNNLYY